MYSINILEIVELVNTAMKCIIERKSLPDVEFLRDLVPLGQISLEISVRDDWLLSLCKSYLSALRRDKINVDSNSDGENGTGVESLPHLSVSELATQL